MSVVLADKVADEGTTGTKWCVVHNLLCRLPTLAEAAYRDHYTSSCVVVGVTKNSNSVTFFSGTTQASYLIFVTEHQYGDLYRVTHF